MKQELVLQFYIPQYVKKEKKLIKLETFLHGNLRSAILDLWTMSFKMEANGVTPIPPPTNTATSYLYQS